MACLKLSPEQREQAASIQELRCSGHCLNLTTDDSWKKPEKPTVESYMIVRRAALMIKRNLLIRLQRRVVGLLLRPERQGWLVLVRARAWLLHAGPLDFRAGPPHDSEQRWVGLPPPPLQLPSTAILLCHSLSPLLHSTSRSPGSVRTT